MSTVHKNLTGADLHEPKGADTATAGKVYVSNGSGSGSWTDASTIITNTAFTTGDLKPTHKTTADTSWIMWSDGTIGDGSSGATIRANADTSALFTLYWANANCLISGGKGASAAIDYAAHKAISLPPGAGRALGIVGSGSGLTARTLGQTVGEETHLLSTSEMPSHTHAVTDPGHTHAMGNGSGPLTFFSGGGTHGSASGSGGNDFQGLTVTSATTGITIANAGTGSAHNVMQPTTFVNIMVKL